MPLAVVTKGKDPAEIRCKCAVVRLEQRNVPETPIALAVAIKDYQILSHHSFSGSLAGNA
jgi:hypothetical protein